MEWTQYLSALKDIILASAAIFTASIAFKGINKWKEELKGKAEFEAATKLLKNVLIIRDELENARAPFIAAHEFPDKYNPLNKSPKSKADAYLHILKSRTQHISQVLIELKVSKVHCEALWGEASNTIEMRAFSLLINKYFISIQHYIKYLSKDDHANRHDYFEVIESIIFKSSENNRFDQEIENAISKIEQSLLPYLKRNIIDSENTTSRSLTKLLDDYKSPYWELYTIIFIITAFAFAIGAVFSLEHIPFTPSKLLSGSGILLDILGACILAYPLFISKEEAFDTAGLGLNEPEIKNKSSKHPSVISLFKQSQCALYGILCLIFGFSFQLVALFFN